MKKQYIILGLLLITVNAIFSQGQKINIGVTAGINYASLSSSESESLTDYKGKVGFLVGGFATIRLTKAIAIQPELLFSLQGANFSIDPNKVFISGDPSSPAFFSEIEGTINEAMILVPVTVIFDFNDTIEMQVGPQLGYNIHREIIYSTDIQMDGDFFKLESDSKKAELGAILGVGYNFSKKFLLSMRYAYGVTKRQDVNTSVLSLIAQYKI